MHLQAAAHKSCVQDRIKPICPETQPQDHCTACAPGTLTLARALLYLVWGSGGDREVKGEREVMGRLVPSFHCGELVPWPFI